MRRPLTICLLFLLVSWTGAAGRAPAAEFQAGAAVADITPAKWPLPMVGTFSHRPATQAWDALMARAVVLDDGHLRIGLVLVDSCYLPRKLCDEAKRRAARSAGLQPDKILISATHTHTAPAARDRREVRADADYVEQITAGIESALRRAAANLTPAEFGWGVARVPEEVFNRRWHMKPGGIVDNPFGRRDDIVRMNPPAGSDLLDRPAGPTDPEVYVISLRTVDGRPLALLANYSLHYVGGVPAGGVSADYFGEFSRLVELRVSERARSDPPPVALLTNGTSGDVNNIDFFRGRTRSGPFERIRSVADRVAQAALEAAEKCEHRRDITLDMRQRLLTLALRRPSEEDVRRAREFLAAEDESSLPPRAKAYARWTVELSEPSHEEELVLQALRIGDLGVTAIPCEVFCEIGLEIKQRSPFRGQFTIELANGHYGYLPTPRQHALGGYETWLGTNRLETQASIKIVDSLMAQLQEMESGPQE